MKSGHRLAGWALAALVASGASAQAPSRAPGGTVARPAAAPELPLLDLPDFLLAHLGTTPEQRGKLDALRARRDEDMRQVLRAARRERERGAARVYLQAAFRKNEAAAVGVLDASQQRQFQQMQQSYASFAGLGRPAQALLAVTGLTADQRERLRDLGREVSRKRQQAQLRAGQGGLTGVLDARREADEAAEAGIRKLLQPAQEKQFIVALKETPLYGRSRSASPE